MTSTTTLSMCSNSLCAATLVPHDKGGMSNKGQQNRRGLAAACTLPAVQIFHLHRMLHKSALPQALYRMLVHAAFKYAARTEATPLKGSHSIGLAALAAAQSTSVHHTHVSVEKLLLAASKGSGMHTLTAARQARRRSCRVAEGRSLS